MPDLVQEVLRPVHRFLARHLQHVDRRFDDVLQDRHVRPEIEALEHHRELGPDPRKLARILGLQAAVTPAAQHDLLAGDDDPALVRRLQQVDAAQERALAGAAGAQDRDHVALGRRHRHALEHLDRAELLLDALCGQGRRILAHGIPGNSLSAIARFAPLISRCVKPRCCGLAGIGGGRLESATSALRR